MLSIKKTKAVIGMFILAMILGFAYTIVPMHKQKFYGVWRVEKIAGFSRVYALDKEEIEAFVNTEVKYKRNSFRNAYTTYKDVNYKINIVKEGFPIYWEMLDGLEVKERNKLVNKQMIEDYNVEVQNYDFGEKSSTFGLHFIVIDENHLLVHYEGVYFSLIRM